jgi:hypothetical protein
MSQKAGDQRLNGHPALILRRGRKIDTVIAVRIDNPSTLLLSKPWLRRLLTPLSTNRESRSSARWRVRPIPCGRQASPHDRRVKVLAVTWAGVAARERLIEALITPDPALDRLSSKQLGGIVTALRQVLA